MQGRFEEAARSLADAFPCEQAGLHGACQIAAGQLIRVSCRLVRTRQPADTTMKANKIYAGVIVGIVLLASSPFMLGLIWPRINEVRTGETPQYADLQPQRFNQPVATVFTAALTLVQARGWDVRLTEPAAGIIEATATTRLLKFKDDVTITITPEGGGTVVNLRSKSRIGKGDLGTNARRIRVFQAELAKRL